MGFCDIGPRRKDVPVIFHVPVIRKHGPAQGQETRSGGKRKNQKQSKKSHRPKSCSTNTPSNNQHPHSSQFVIPASEPEPINQHLRQHATVQ
jgi:hypothetical protein